MILGIRISLICCFSVPLYRFFIGLLHSFSRCIHNTKIILSSCISLFNCFF